MAVVPSDGADDRGGGAGRRGLGLPKTNLIVVPRWLSPSGLGGVAGIKKDPSSCSRVAALTLPRLEVDVAAVRLVLYEHEHENTNLGGK
jgi:hypothetical protein